MLVGQKRPCGFEVFSHGTEAVVRGRWHIIPPESVLGAVSHDERVTNLTRAQRRVSIPIRTRGLQRAHVAVLMG